MVIRSADDLKELKGEADWRDCDISELCALQRGFDITEATRKPGSIPVYSSSGVSYFHDESKILPPAVITGRKGLLGRVFFVEEPCWPHDTTLWVKDFKGNDPRFVAVFLGNFGLERFDAATSVPTLNRNSLVGHSIRLPPLAEQRAIAEALSDVDALLGALDRLIAKKRDLKQAAMQQLLTGRTRLPGFHGEWCVRRLGEIATCFSGGTPRTDVSAYYDGEIPWIVSGDLNREYIGNVEGRISECGLRSSSAKMVDSGTLLIALYGATSGVAAVSMIRGAINQAVLAIVPRDDIAMFLYFKLQLMKNWLISTYSQGGQPNLSGDIVKSICLEMPSRPEQAAIAGVLGDFDAELASLEVRREKTRALKQGMMQELLTGRTRLV